MLRNSQFRLNLETLASESDFCENIGMNNTTQTELERFREFVDEKLANGGVRLSPEETLDLWRAQNPTAEEITKSVAAINGVIADIDAGDPGKDASDVLSELRKKHGIIT